MAVQVLGKVAYFNKGAYNSQTNYEINDVVSYNGSSYVSLNDNNQGNLPTNTNYWSVVAEKGDKGDTGKPFVIEKTYSTIESMVADYDNMNVNDYVMIQGSIEEQENATLWTKREVEVSPYKWAYLADFSGASGITGATPNIHIGNVTEGNEPSVTRRSGSSNENPILDFVLKTGAKGDTGATGNGISSIEKTSTSGLVDTYTITFTNGTSTTIEVTNGRGIVSIAKTSSVDYVDTYTITYNDGTTSTFEVTNSEVTEEEFDDVVDELNYLYDDLPKVEGEGTNLTLNNTRKGKMSNVLRGNTSQESTTGKNLFNNQTPNINQITTWTPTDNGGLFTSSTFWKNLGNKLELDTTKQYTFSFGARNSTNLYYYIKTYNDNTYETVKTTIVNDGTALSKTFTPDSEYVAIYFANGGILQNVEIPNIQLEIGSSVTDFEPYTGGIASPNPDYPQDVDVVSGNNTIKVEGKNLFDGVFRQGNQHNNWNTSRIFSNKNDWKVNVGDKFTFSTNLDLTTFDYSFYIMQYPYLSVSSNTTLYISNYQTTNTFTINCEYEGYFGFTMRKKNESNITPSDVSNYWFQIEKGSSATTYQPYQSQSYPINLGTMELCKIGDYQDYIAKSTGKNLFDKDNDITANTGLTSQGETFSSNDYCMKSWLELKANTQYTLSDGDNTKTKRICFYSDKTESSFISVVEQGYKSVTFTTPTNCKYVRIQIKQTELNYEMLNEGTIALPYEPFGKDKWYKHSEIGKVVLDGSENGWSSQYGTNLFNNGTIANDNKFIQGYGFSNYYKYNPINSGIDAGTVNGEFVLQKSGTAYNLLFKNTNYSTVEDFKAWLSTHNTIIYYVLATPTNTEITDQTLIAQLDNFEKALSYNTQTNISQENNDLPFIISASAFMSLKYLFGNLETRVAELEG